MFGLSLVRSLFEQRSHSQRLRRQVEMDAVMMDEEQDREYSRDGESGALAVLYDLIINSILRMVPGGGTALDVASGSGQLLGKLAHSMPDFRFTGTDISDHMLTLARANADRYGAQNVEFRNHSMFDLESFQGGPFDLITWCFAAHHCANAEEAVRVLNGANRLLKPGGAFFLFDVSRPKTGRLAVWLSDTYNRGQGSWYYQDSLDSYRAAFTFDELDRILRRSTLRGWRHVEPRFGNFFQAAYLPARGVGSRSRQVNHLRALWQKRDYAILRLGFWNRLP